MIKCSQHTAKWYLGNGTSLCGTFFGLSPLTMKIIQNGLC